MPRREKLKRKREKELAEAGKKCRSLVDMFSAASQAPAEEDAPALVEDAPALVDVPAPVEDTPALVDARPADICQVADGAQRPTQEMKLALLRSRKPHASFKYPVRQFKDKRPCSNL